MPGMTITWDQRVALGRRLGIDPEDVDAGRVLREVGKLARRRERSYADTDPTRILKLDPDETRPIETTVPTDGRAFTDDEERALGDRLARLRDGADQPRHRGRVRRGGRARRHRRRSGRPRHPGDGRAGPVPAWPWDDVLAMIVERRIGEAA